MDDLKIYLWRAARGKWNAAIPEFDVWMMFAPGRDEATHRCAQVARRLSPVLHGNTEFQIVSGRPPGK